MLQVMIIDDEPSVVKALHCSIDWEALGMRVAGIAANGKEGFDIAQKQHIDIAICDIRMPGISGLELCETLRRQFANMQFIITSGYAEFAYAERAIRVGVVGYCLKPLDYEQVTRCLMKAKLNLKKEESRNNEDTLLETLKEENSTKIIDCLRENGLVATYYSVAVVVEREHHVKFDGITQIAIHLGRRMWGYLLDAKDLDNWLDQLKNAPETCEGCGYSKEPLRPEQLYHELKECQIKAYQRFICDKQRFCAEIDESKATVWLESVRKEDKQDKLWKLLDQIDACGARDFTIRSALKLHNIVGLFLEKSDQMQDFYSYSMEQLIAEYKDFHEMVNHLKEMLQKTDEKENTESFSNASFMKILLYVDSHYTENLTIAEASRVLFMNPNYIGQLFKKEMGITFVQYVTQKRLEDAKQLLTSTDMLVADIAAAVGFNDYFYFCKIFKKNLQMTPMQYRQKMVDDMDNFSI